MFTRTAGIVAAGTQNRRVISVGYRMCYRTHRSVGYNCHRTHRSVGYCIRISQGNLCGVPDLLQNSQKCNCRVLWCNCHRTHRSIGYCGTTVTELTEVQGNVVLRSQNSQGNLCRVSTDGHYPRYRCVLAHFCALGSTRFYYGLCMIIIKDRINGRLKRACVRTP